MRITLSNVELMSLLILLMILIKCTSFTLNDMNEVFDHSFLGQYISTKGVGKNNWNRVDISNDYKHAEGSPLEDVAVRRALRLSNNPTIRPNSKDVTFNVRTSSYVYVGNDVRVTIEMRNTGMKTVNIQTTLSGNVVMYNGVSLNTIPADQTEVKLGPYACKY